MDNDLELCGYLDMNNGQYVEVYLRQNTPAAQARKLREIDAMPVQRLMTHDVVERQVESSKGGRPKADIKASTVKRLRRSGLSNRAIANQLKVSEGTIRNILSDA